MKRPPKTNGGWREVVVRLECGGSTLIFHKEEFFREVRVDWHPLRLQ